MIPNPARALLACLALTAATLSATAAMAETQVLSGTVFYRERIALPPDAAVEVRLLDVSLADAPARTLAVTTIMPQGQVPVPYRLEYDDAEILRGHSYALQARITSGEGLEFTNTTHHPVLAGTDDQTDILVERVVDLTAPGGSWLAEDILGGGVIDRLQTVLEIGADGAISGTGGCNRIRGEARIAGDAITFGPIAATRMACPEAAMDQESRFLAALADVRKWQVDPMRGKLALLDQDGKALIVLARQ